MNTGSSASYTLRARSRRGRHRRAHRAPRSATQIALAAYRVVAHLTNVLDVRSITAAQSGEESLYVSFSVVITLHNGHTTRLAVSVNAAGELAVSHGESTVSVPVRAPNARNPERAVLFLERATLAALSETLGYHVGVAKGYKDTVEKRYVRTSEGALQPTASLYADLVWLAQAGLMYGWEVLSWRQRSWLRSRIHRVINDHGLRMQRKHFWARVSADHVRERRDAMFWAVPRIEPVLGLHGRRFGRLRPLADPETGTIPSATLDSVIPGLGNLPAALLSGNTAQQAQLLAATVGSLPGSLWSLLFTSARWGRKLRDPAHIDTRRFPPWLDNVISTAGGPLANAGAQLAASGAGGALDPAMQAQIASRHLIEGSSATINEIQTFSPSLLAYLTHRHAMKIAARGEPANALKDLEEQSRRLYLALAAFLQGPGGRTVTEEQRERLVSVLSRHSEELLKAKASCKEKQLTLARMRGDEAPKRVPKINRRFLRLMIPSIISTGVGTAAAFAFGEGLYGLLGLPGLFATATTMWTMPKFQRRKIEDKTELERADVENQSRADEELRATVLDAVKNTSSERLPSIGAWRRQPARLSTRGPHLAQAAKIAPVSGAAAATTAFIPVMQDLALGVSVSAFLAPWFNALYGSRWDHVVRHQRRVASELEERVVVRELHNQISGTEGYMQGFNDLNQQLAMLTFHIKAHKTRPTWAHPDVLNNPLIHQTTEICDAVAERGSAVLSRRFVAVLEETLRDPSGLATFSHRENVAVFFGNLLPELVAQLGSIPAHERPDEMIRIAHVCRAELATAFDRVHEHDLATAAEAEILDACMAPYLPHDLRIGSMFDEPVEASSVSSARQARLDNEEYVTYTHALTEQAFARKRNGQLATAGRKTALAVQVAAQVSGVVHDECAGRADPSRLTRVLPRVAGPRSL